MRSADVEEHSFSILSDTGVMLAGAMVFDRKTVEVAAAAFYGGLDPLPTITPELQAFADTEARRLGLLDD